MSNERLVTRISDAGSLLITYAEPNNGRAFWSRWKDQSERLSDDIDITVASRAYGDNVSNLCDWQLVEW